MATNKPKNRIKMSIPRKESIKLKEKYDNLIKKFENLEKEHLINQWKIIKEAKEIMEKILGERVTNVRLGKDFGVTEAHIRKCLALSKMNNKTKKLVKDNKIALSKCSVVMNKNETYQDLIIDRIIKEDITKEELSSNLPVFNSKEEILKWNPKSPAEKFKRRADTLAQYLFSKISELSLLLEADIEKIQDKKRLEEKCILLRDKLNIFITKLNGTHIDLSGIDLLDEYELDD